MLSLRAGISTPLGERPRMPEAEPTPELLVSLELTTDGAHHSGEGDRHSGDGDHHSGAPPQSGRLQIGISGRLRSESVVAFDWNGWSPSTGICTQDVTPADMVIQGMEAPARGPLGCGPQSPLQLSHFGARPTAGGVVRSALGGHSLALTCSDDTTTPGTLPSRDVVRRRDHRYYDPLGLPLRTTRFRLLLIRARSPRPRPRRRASRVPRLSLHTCCAPYPAGTPRRLRYPCKGHRLRRDMSGSAPGLFLCRGCRLHFMLRPVCSLPAARLLPPRGLLTPRSGVGVSPARLGPATRRTGAYRGGTCTRWRHAACRRRPLRPSSVCVTTHHGRSLAAPPRIRPESERASDGFHAGETFARASYEAPSGGAATGDRRSRGLPAGVPRLATGGAAAWIGGRRSLRIETRSGGSGGCGSPRAARPRPPPRVW